MKGIQIAVIGGGIIAVAAIISIILISAGPQDKVDPVEDKFLVYTTFYPLQQFTHNISGDAAEVRMLISSGADPHAFDLGPKTIAGLIKADMLVYNGADFEPYIDEIKSSPDFSHIIFVDSSEGINLLEGETHDHGRDKENDQHTDRVSDEILDIIEEFEHGHMNESHAIEFIKTLVVGVAFGSRIAQAPFSKGPCDISCRF